MSFTPPANVLPAPREGLPYGIFSVVPFREGSNDRWESGGVQVEDIRCKSSDGGGIIIPHCEDEEQTGLPKNFGTLAASETIFRPFTVYESYVCSPIGNSRTHAIDTATKQLLAYEEYRVERAISQEFEGVSVLIPTYDEAGSDPYSYSTIDEIIPVAEEAQAEVYGTLGIFHVSRKLGAELIQAGHIEVKNNRLQTLLGTPVVAGGGYEFDGLRITPKIFGYRSEIFTSSQLPYDTLDTSENNHYAVAERSYLLGLNNCPVISVESVDPLP